MNGHDIRQAREALGQRWGLGRPLRMSELGRALRLPASDPGQSIRDYEAGFTRIPGPVAVAIELLMAGAELPGGVAAIRKAS